MKIIVSIEVTAQRASNEVCDKAKRPHGTLEVMSEGYRVAFANTEDEAIEAARGMVGSDLTTSVTVTGRSIQQPTLEQFRATRKDHDDIRTVESFADFEPSKGHTYWDDRLLITATDVDGTFNVDLFGGEYSGTLKQCETELFDAAMGEDVFTDRFSRQFAKTDEYPIK